MKKLLGIFSILTMAMPAFFDSENPQIEVEIAVIDAARQVQARAYQTGSASGKSK